MNLEMKPVSSMSSGLSILVAAIGALLGSATASADTLSFRPKVDYLIGDGTSVVKVADVNRDGKPDIVTANYDDKNLSVLLGNGAGRFRAKRDFAAGLHPVAVVMADVDLDGRPDLLSANQSGVGTLSVLINDGR